MDKSLTLDYVQRSVLLVGFLIIGFACVYAINFLLIVFFVLSILIAVVFWGTNPVINIYVILNLFAVLVALILSEINGKAVNDFYSREASSGLIQIALIYLVILMFYKLVEKLINKRQHSTPFNLPVLINSRLFFIYYLFFLLIGKIAESVAFLVPGLTQILLRLGDLRFFIFFILSIHVFRTQSSYKYLFIILGFETVLGFLSFFSSFKTVYFYLFISYILVRPILSFKTKIFGIFFILLISILLLFWQSIKPTFRNYVSNGTMTQVLIKSPSEVFGFIINNFNLETFNQFDLNESLRRVGYVEYYFKSLENLKNQTAANGGLLKSNLEFIFLPRFFNPTKESKDDSKKTRLLTGIDVSDGSSSTSISTSHFIEIYYDYKIIGIFVYSLILALVAYLVNYFIFNYTGFNAYYSFFLSFIILSEFISLGSDFIVAIGGSIYSFVIHVFLFRPVHFKIQKWLKII